VPSSSGPSDPATGGSQTSLRDRLIGFGERSIKKSYFPELQRRLLELERFRALLDQTTEAIFLVRVASGRIVDVNCSACAMLGYRCEELVDVEFSTVVGAFGLNALKRRLGAVNCTRLLDAVETELHGVAGPVPVEISYRFVEFDSDAYAVIVARNIAERKKAEEELAALNRQLEALVEERTRALASKAAELEAANRRLLELDELKNTFLSSVSHELRTPLTSILGFSKIIHRDFEKGFAGLAQADSQRAKARRITDNLRIIETESSRLTRLINDVLDVANIESGDMTWSPAPLDMADLARHAVLAAAGQYSANPAVELRLEAANALPQVHADPDRMAQVLANLLHNAAKFTRSGTVTLRVFAVDSGRAVRLEVADTGVGIPGGELERIFDKFQQVRRGDTLNDATRGTGLGLAICRQIVERCGGRIWAESELDKGSVFIVDLPALEQ